jgi:hypothetical protein
VIGFLAVYATTGQFFIQPNDLGKGLHGDTIVDDRLWAGDPDMPVWLHRLWPMLWWLASAAAVVALVDYVRLGNRFTAEYHAAHQNPKR